MRTLGRHGHYYKGFVCSKEWSYVLVDFTWCMDDNSTRRFRVMYFDEMDHSSKDPSLSDLSPRSFVAHRESEIMSHWLPSLIRDETPRRREAISLSSPILYIFAILLHIVNIVLCHFALVFP